MTAAEPTADGFELEVTYDVDDTTSLPDWSQLPGVAHVGDAEIRELDARYYDTLDYALGRAHYALRRREGGHDAGWHVKGPRTPEGRRETGWPLAADASIAPGTAVPAQIREYLADLVTADLAPIARIRNTRRAYELRDAGGGLVAEFVDDHVRSLDERTGIERNWREWEIELGPAGPGDGRAREEFFTAVAAAVSRAGGRPASSDSKLGRALGR